MDKSVDSYVRIIDGAVFVTRDGDLAKHEEIGVSLELSKGGQAYDS